MIHANAYTSPLNCCEASHPSIRKEHLEHRMSHRRSLFSQPNPIHIRIRPVEMKSSFLLLLLFLVVALGGSFRGQAAGLTHHFYKKSCPQAEQIVQDIIWKHVAGNSELPAKFLRMFFHDCFVRGCDASVLINSTANSTAEKDAAPNLSLAGFDVIDEVKTALEKACPNTVSCADIVALGARDSVSFQFNKSLWEVQTGRRDGTVSLASEARANIPSPFSNFTALANRFANKTLDVEDLVVLSGIMLWKHSAKELQSFELL